MPKREFILAELSRVALVDPPQVRTAHDALEELRSLGLTPEASLGVLKVLMRAGSPAPAIDHGGG